VRKLAMRAFLNNHSEPFTAPPGAAEEFLGAIEAATGEEQKKAWTDPMTSADVREAVSRLIMTSRPDRGLDSLVRSGTMQAVLPEVAAMVGFGEGVRHKDVWSHTKKVLLRSPMRLEARLAALFHDIGKVPTRRFEGDGQVTFLGHPEVGARMFEKIAGRLSMPKKQKERVRFLIASHLRASAYDETWTDSAVRRFARDAGDALDDLLELSKADITSKYKEKVKRGTEQIELLKERIEALKAIDSKPKPLPKGLGNAIMERFGISPGPGLGKIITRLQAEVESGRLGVQESFEHYLSFLAQNKSLIDAAFERREK
jgi:poly(A) polymerase